MENMISMKRAIGGSFLAICTLVVAQALAGVIASVLVLIEIPNGICNIIAGVLYLGFAYLLILLFAKKVLKMSVNELGIPSFQIKRRWFLIAFMLPIVVKVVYLLLFEGEYISSDMNGSMMFSTLSAGIFYIGIAAGFVEEMVFRGVILSLLKKRWNTMIAVLVPSVLFGIVHILGMKYSFGSCILVILAGTMVGIMFSLIVIESGSVWNSGIVHAIWNMVVIGGGLAIGEKPDEYSVMTYVLESKSFAITGGEFGIESSVISLIGYIIVAGIAFVMIKKSSRQPQNL